MPRSRKTAALDENQEEACCERGIGDPPSRRSRRGDASLPPAHVGGHAARGVARSPAAALGADGTPRGGGLTDLSRAVCRHRARRGPRCPRSTRREQGHADGALRRMGDRSAPAAVGGGGPSRAGARRRTLPWRISLHADRRHDRTQGHLRLRPRRVASMPDCVPALERAHRSPPPAGAPDAHRHGWSHEPHAHDGALRHECRPGPLRAAPARCPHAALRTRRRAQ